LKSLCLKSFLSRLEQINFKSYFLRTNSTWGQLRSGELTPSDMNRPSRLGSTFLGRLPGLPPTQLNSTVESRRRCVLGNGWWIVLLLFFIPNARRNRLT